MEMILVDWTRMGKTYCVAGFVAEGDGWRTVRPMPLAATAPIARPRLWGVVDALLGGSRSRQLDRPDRPPPNVGWFFSQLDTLRRWDIVELVEPKPADVERPHTEDVWVRSMRPTGRTVASEDRPAILRQTCAEETTPYFGVPLLTTRSSAFLRPGTGERSLVTVIVPSHEIWFDASQREGAAEPDVRARLRVPGVGTKLLPVKDHHLLCHAERSAADALGRARVMRETILKMAPTIAVRVGLSRGYDSGRGERRCWLMADGFFPAEEVQL